MKHAIGSVVFGLMAVANLVLAITIVHPSAMVFAFVAAGSALGSLILLGHSHG
jgi:hypothetical protein